jgi:hypothetical protein
MTTVTEIAKDVFRICTLIPEFDLQFNDQAPLKSAKGPLSAPPSFW